MSHDEKVESDADVGQFTLPYSPLFIIQTGMIEAEEDSCTGAGGCSGSINDPPPPPSPSHHHSPLPIAPSPSPSPNTDINRMTLPELKRRLEAHIRDSGVVDSVLASLRASLLLPDGGPPPQASPAAVAADEDEAAKWRRRAEELEEQVRECEARAQVSAASAAAEARERVRRECEERVRQEMEQGAWLSCCCWWWWIMD